MQSTRRRKIEHTKQKKRKQTRRLRKGKMRGGKIHIKNFTNVLGSGGFGKIVASENGRRVVKLYYKLDQCELMRSEYNYQQKAYDAIQAYPLSQLRVPKLLDLDQSEIDFQGKRYLCGIEMERIHMLSPDILQSLVKEKGNQETPIQNGLVHLVLTGYGTNKEQPREKGQIGPMNPSRGIMANPDFIDALLTRLPDEVKGSLKEITDIAFYIGYALAIQIAVAGLYVHDVEYLLGADEAGRAELLVMDFGMGDTIDFEEPTEVIVQKMLKGDPAKGKLSPGIALDLYYPSRDDEALFEAFEKGVNNALEAMGDTVPESKKEIVREVLKQLG
jgi:hypothetical protein